MSTAKAVILTSVILATILFVVYGTREVKRNEKKSFNEEGDPKREIDTDKEFTLEEIVNEIKSQQA